MIPPAIAPALLDLRDPEVDPSELPEGSAAELVLLSRGADVGVGGIVTVTVTGGLLEVLEVGTAEEEEEEEEDEEEEELEEEEEEALEAEVTVPPADTSTR